MPTAPKSGQEILKLIELTAPYYQGWADPRGSGTRYGPVHLFKDPFPKRFPKKGTPLCGRAVKQWNFEGNTEEDFCPKCLRLAREAKK